MKSPILGAHTVSLTRTWAVARVRGVTASLLAILMGSWILAQQRTLFQGPAWVDMREVINDRIDIVGWIILLCGVIGIMGLILRKRSLSLASCLIGIAWFGWMGAFLWYANFTGEQHNVVAILSLYGLGEYVYRMATLIRIPNAEHDPNVGW